MLALAQTAFVTLLLVLFVSAINSSVERLIVHPLESTWEKVQILRRNPMSVMAGDFERHAGVLSVLQSKKRSVRNEIGIVDTSLVKIAQLLALGFGEAGANMIVQNLDDSQTVSAAESRG